MDPFIDFDDTTMQDQPVDLIDYLTASSSSAPRSATEEGSHWTLQDQQQMGYQASTQQTSSSKVSVLPNITTTADMFSYPSPTNTSNALAASLGFHLGDATFGTTAGEEGLSDDALARLLFTPSDPFLTSFEGGETTQQEQEQERELAAAYAAFAQQQGQGQQDWFHQQQHQIVQPELQPFGVYDGGQHPSSSFGFPPTQQPSYTAFVQQQQPFSPLDNNPRSQAGMEATLGAFRNNMQQQAAQTRRYSAAYPLVDPKQAYDAYEPTHRHNQSHIQGHNQSQTHGHGHGQGHSPASTTASAGVHSTLSPTASHGAVSVSLHPSSNHPSSSSSSSSVGLSPGGTSGTSGSPVHAHATPASSTGTGSGASGGLEAQGGGRGGLKPFVVGEGMTMAPQLLNVHYQQPQHLNASMIGGELVADGRRGSVNVVETAVGGTLALPASTTKPTEKPSVKLHNKVEKRYRYNVKNALETLRDAVPRLRQVYKTSLPLELATTDREDAQGLMGGLERLGKPTKKTVMYGARLYIEYLETEQRVAEVRVKRGEEVVRRLCGDDEWLKWVERTEEEVGSVRRDYLALLEEKARVRAEASGMDDVGTVGVGGPQQVKVEQEDDEDEDDEEEEERPKKRTRKDVLAEGKPGGKARKNAAASSTTTTATGKRKFRIAGAAAATTTSATAVSAFYSFGLAYMVFPRATSLFGSTSTDPANVRNTSSSTHSGGGSGGKVLLAAAKSAEELGRRALPSHRAPGGDTILDGVWYVLLGLAMTAFALWIARRSRGTVAGREEVVYDDDEGEGEGDAEGQGQEKWERIGVELGVGTVFGLLEEGFARIPLVGRPLRVSQDWYKLLSAFVGGDMDMGWLANLQLRLRLARAAATSESCALLHALYRKSDSERKIAWFAARKLAIDSNIRAIQDVAALPPRQAYALLERIKPTCMPIEGIANQLVLEDLDRLFTQIYVGLIAASYPDQSNGTQLRLLADNLQRSSAISSLADSAFKTRIYSVLTGVERDSEAHKLGLVLIGLWGHIVGQEPLRQRALANMLIAQQLRHTDESSTGGLISVDLVLGLILPGYRSPAATSRYESRSKAGISNMAQELDTIAAVCLRYLLLLRSVPLLAKSEANRQERQRSSLYVRQACLEIRVLLARPAFDTQPDSENDQPLVIAARDIQVLGIHADPYSEIDPLEGTNAGQDAEEHAEQAEFSHQTDRLIDLMTIVGYRAAGRAAGRDDDSGVEGDLDEL
ncbi:hypothetical protein QFC21_002425 [Naganishia friedmannii]|uniref:Uncharacterized protein n=1 Tax=Naganishia friedmannii TaxID=89922 RepID=A0ACC2VYJ0_9TREE|nr:hypothetical protein QFC21_002425 [Naganishia friedmannii]